MKRMKEATLEDIKTLYEKYSGVSENEKGNIHLIIPPKTGSTQCRAMFKKAAKAEKKINVYWGNTKAPKAPNSGGHGAHTGYGYWNKISPSELKKPALRIGLVRNPWDWLVSFNRRFSTGYPKFTDFLHWWGLIKNPSRSRHRTRASPRPSSHSRRQSKIVRYTHSPMCQLFYDDATVGPHLIISTESVNEGCQMIFDALNINVKAEGHINQFRHSKKKKKIDFYTSKEIELVRERLSVLVDFFKYYDGPDTGWNYETPVLINDNSHMDYLPIREETPDCWKKLS